MIVRPALLYGLECWLVQKAKVQMLMTAEMRMLRWMYGYTRMDRIRNRVITNIVKGAPIEDKTRETRLKWFGDRKRSVDVPTRRCEKINLPQCRRGRGLPQKSLNEVVRHNMKFLRLTENIAQNKSLLRLR